MNEAGDLSRRRINRLVNELAQLIKRVIKIENEILQGEKGELEQEIVQEQQAAGSGKVTDVSQHSWSTTNTNAGRSTASTGGTSSATTGSSWPTSANARRPKARPRLRRSKWFFLAFFTARDRGGFDRIRGYR